MPSPCIQKAADGPKPIVKPTIASRVDNLAWVFSDKFGLRQRLLQELNFRTLHFYHDLHSRTQCQRLLNEIELQRPLVLWIRFAGPCAGSGNRQDALRAENLIRILACQRNANRFVIVEASERSQVWNLQCVRDCTKTLLQTSHRWCRYENMLKSNEMPCSSKIRLLTNFHVVDGSECRCGDVQHAKSKELGSRSAVRFENVLRTVMHRVCLANFNAGDSSQTLAK